MTSHINTAACRCCETRTFHLALKVNEKADGPSSFVPPLKGMPIPNFSATFASILYAQKVDPATTNEEKTEVKKIVTDLLATAISKINFFGATKAMAAPPRPAYLYGLPTAAAVTKVAEPRTAYTYIDFCLATENEALVETIVERLVDNAGVAPAEAQNRAKLVLLPLLPLVGAKMKARPAGAPTVPGVQRLFDAAIQLYLSSLTQAGPTNGDITSLVQACILEWGTRMLINT